MTSQELKNLRELVGNRLLGPQKEEFKMALLEAMQGRTQVQFSADSGISRAQLSRLLKGEFSTPPSTETLEKIADHSAGRVNMARLKKALGITVLTSDSEDKFEKLPYTRRNAIQAEELRRGFIELTEKPRRYETIEAVLTTLTLLYARDTTQYQIDERYTLDDFKYKDEKDHDAEEACNVFFRWENSDTSVDMGCVVFYCKTQKGSVIITDLAFDVKTLYEYKNRVALEIKDGLTTGEEETNPDDYSLCYVTTIKSAPETFVKLMDKDTGILRENDGKLLASLYAVAGEEEKKTLDILRERIREFES